VQLLNEQVVVVKEHFGVLNGQWNFVGLQNLIQFELEKFKTPHSSKLDFFYEQFHATIEILDEFIDRIDFFGFDSIGVEGEEVENVCTNIAVLLVAFKEIKK